MKRVILSCGPIRGFGVALVLLVLFSLSGCGPRRPLDMGDADTRSLGVGIGRHLADALEQGGVVLVVDIPQPKGYSLEIQKNFIKGLQLELKGKDIKVRAVEFSEDEAQKYNEGQYPSLHSDFAATAVGRYLDEDPVAIVSLMGWPRGDVSFLPEDIVFVGISYSYGEDPSRWTSHFKRVVSVAATNARVEGRPSKKALKTNEDLYRWFDKRFSVETGGDR